MDLTLTTCLIASMALGAALDVRNRRIPNWLTVSSLLVALAIRALPGGPEFLPGLFGFGLAFLITLPLFGFRLMGGGDAKLLMVVGAFLGPIAFLLAFLYTSVVGGLMALGATVVSGQHRALVARCIAFVTSILTLGSKGLKLSLESPSTTTIPYGVAIAVGAVTAHFLPLIG